MAQAQIEMSDVLRQFLHTRLDADMPDAEVAYRFITARVVVGDDEAHNWFDLKLIGDVARISYTTATAINKAREKGIPLYPMTAGGHRTIARPSAVARRVAQLDDHPKWGRALDLFANAALATLHDVPDVTLVTGKELVRRYSEDAHCRCQRLGDLASSCMRYIGYQDRFELYADVAAMAIIICPTCRGTRARALVWTDHTGNRWLDRPYGSPTSHEFLYTWAKTQKIGRVWPNVNQKRKAVMVDVPRTDYVAGAYHDSLMFWCRTCHVLSNYECKNADHDKVLLRSTHAQGHTGWWGRCPECNYPFRDDRRVCTNKRTCGGCGKSHCADGCPNGCWDCHGCGAWMRKQQTTCLNHCVTCSDPCCGYVSTISAVIAQHGHCRACNARLQKEKVSDVPLTWNARYVRWEGSCPECQYSSRIEPHANLAYLPKETESLVACRYVHAGHASKTSAHCPGCHHVMRWVVEPRPKVAASGTSSFTKTVHQPSMWESSGLGKWDAVKDLERREDYERDLREKWRASLTSYRQRGEQ